MQLSTHHWPVVIFAVQPARSDLTAIVNVNGDIASEDVGDRFADPCRRALTRRRLAFTDVNWREINNAWQVTRI